MFFFFSLDQHFHSVVFQIMNRLCNVNNNFPYDNSLLVLDMVLRSLWGTTQPIDWENVARLVPGFTPKEVIKT